MSDEDDVIAGQLAEIPLEDLQRLKSQGHGHFGAAFRILKKEASRKDTQEGGAGEERRRRANKNRPMEMSSKIPVPRFREVIQAPKTDSRDPRFESLCGDFDEARFKRSYGFIYQEALPQEAERVRKALKKEKDKERKGVLKHRLSEIESELNQEERRRSRENQQADEKEKERVSAEKGKTPYFVSKPKRRRDQLVDMYKELKAQGKLESFLAKRRKKNASKDHKKIPSARR